MLQITVTPYFPGKLFLFVITAQKLCNFKLDTSFQSQRRQFGSEHKQGIDVNLAEKHHKWPEMLNDAMLNKLNSCF